MTTTTTTTNTQLNEETVTMKMPTLVRRVSDLFKDRPNSGPPTLFGHSSMEKIRHCCQNLNLFPYLLYSFHNSKSHPVARKVKLYVGIILKYLSEQLLSLYLSLQQAALSGLKKATITPTDTQETEQSKVTDRRLLLRLPQKRKRKEPSIFLVIAVYLAPLILILQLLGLCSLMIFGKYTPGFIFLVTALLCLAYIAMKIMFHNSGTVRRPRKAKRKTD